MTYFGIGSFLWDLLKAIGRRFDSLVDVPVHFSAAFAVAAAVLIVVGKVGLAVVAALCTFLASFAITRVVHWKLGSRRVPESPDRQVPSGAEQELAAVLGAIPVHYTSDLEQISSSALVPAGKAKNSLLRLRDTGLVSIVEDNPESVRYKRTSS